ncbi:MAG: IS3 family transposase, partial [Nitrosomonas sp.]
REEIFDYIEVFYNRKRRHSFTNGMSPVDFENQFLTRPTSV